MQSEDENLGESPPTITPLSFADVVEQIELSTEATTNPVHRRAMISRLIQTFEIGALRQRALFVAAISYL